MGWIQTFSGRKVDPCHLRPSDVCIEDIAHSLSLQCRFGGHVREFYSVAQHSVYVATSVPSDLVLAGLLHDAAEAYISDIVTPVKRELREIAQMEQGALWAICVALGVSEDAVSAPAVKEADLRMLLTEQRDLLGPQVEPWGIPGEPYSGTIVPWSAAQAETEFLWRYEAYRERD